MQSTIHAAWKLQGLATVDNAILVVMTANFITYSHKKQEKAGTVPGGFLAILSSLLTH